VGRQQRRKEETVNNHAQDPARAEADLIDLRVQLLAEREGLDKWNAYQKYLSSPDGMRKLADLRLVQRRYAEEDQLRSAAQWLEQDDET
jgi:hypothetical protein